MTRHFLRDDDLTPAKQGSLPLEPPRAFGI
jgi:hypothetical protein